MSDYIDTSLLVAALADEVASAKAQRWLADRATGGLHISDWVITEVSSALSMKVRMGDLTLDERALALSQFHKLTAESLTILPVNRSHFQSAAHLTDQHQLGLRASDALHLAIALDISARLCTLDRRLAEAGHHVGASVLLLE